jgi:hypothetical protein
MVAVPKDEVDAEEMDAITVSSGDEEEIQVENIQEAVSCKTTLQEATTSRTVLAQRNV